MHRGGRDATDAAFTASKISQDIAVTSVTIRGVVPKVCFNTDAIGRMQAEQFAMFAPDRS
jgi:hypothetical protein